jgi:hypothetical protein
MRFARSLPRTTAVASLVLAIAGRATTLTAQDSTASIHYKGVTLTPVGFAAAEAFWRQRNITADVGSSFNAIPFSGTTNGSVSEFRATGRQSRIGMLATGNAGDIKATGFFEADFLGVGISSNSTESNSYALRPRQFFVSAGLSDGLTISGGQMWSLITTNKKGLAPRSEAVPLTIEAQYAAGFDWARQFGFRVTKSLGEVTTFGVAVEGAQTTFAARNAPTNILLGQVGGSQLNATSNYSYDYAPDVIAKLAFDPKGWGHWELKAVGRILRDRIVDVTGCPGGVSNCSRNTTTPAGGVGFGAYVPVMQGTRDLVDVGLSGLWGRGIGRYGTSQLPDATIGSDSALAPIRSAHVLLTLETHPTASLDVYGYGGAEYADRTTFVNSAGKGVGYGSPLNNNTGCELEFAPTGPFVPGAPGGATPCNADTRSLWQANVGFWYRFYKGAAGTVQWGAQYSYTSRNTWDGLGLQPQATNNMAFTSFRYILP